MIFILEGPDGSGKTTLAVELLRLMPGAGYWHEGPPPKTGSILGHYIERMHEAVENPRGAVLDRLAMGELVYGPLYNRHGRFDETDFGVFEVERLALGAVQILCLPPYDQCRTVWESRKAEEMIADGHVFQESYRGWEALARIAVDPFDACDIGDTLLYDWTKCPPRRFAKGLLGKDLGL